MICRYALVVRLPDLVLIRSLSRVAVSAFGGAAVALPYWEGSAMIFQGKKLKREGGPRSHVERVKLTKEIRSAAKGRKMDRAARDMAETRVASDRSARERAERVMSPDEAAAWQDRKGRL